MNSIRVVHDRRGRTLTIWLDDPAAEAICTEAASEVVVMKDAAGRVLGLEILNIDLPAGELAVELHSL